jgi:hypothetical protein
MLPPVEREGSTMTITDTVHWLHKQMQGALGVGLPVVGCVDWPNPGQADPPQLTRTLDQDDVKRAIDLARRRGIAHCHVLAVWNAVEAAHQAGESKSWIADLIDILDNLPPGTQPVGGGRR